MSGTMQARTSNEVLARPNAGLMDEEYFIGAPGWRKVMSETGAACNRCQRRKKTGTSGIVAPPSENRPDGCSCRIDKSIYQDRQHRESSAISTYYSRLTRCQ
jgi:hypothetical protein